MQEELITIAEAAHRLDRDRSVVFRRAKRGDFGPVTEIGRGDGRPSLIMVSAAAVDAVARPAAS